MAEKSLVMTFTNRAGTRAAVTVPNVREDITKLEVSAVMDAIIAKNIFESAGGDLIGKQSAQITERTVTELEVR
ncbi:DUF2922 domain-containing protein [Clostridium swellfunianum]|uniref:DUF2922 domain-containing protein n=1 Tax=Clostridium swellfunianum TaxID=1367462 RepID=UPI00202ED172|nr:DUF2922 domain-containing protein [Clostridium swellfunianum]MCM0647425.1 DUF2922 domain-containing protein [Clostridium swellfunianum]